MAIPTHRHSDARVCGDTTISSCSNVWANGLLLAHDGDIDTCGAGNLHPSGDEGNVYCHGLLVMNHSPNPASADGCCPVPPIHCAPSTAQGSPNVFNGP